MLFQLSPKERLGYACIVGLMLFAFGWVGARHLRQPAPIVFQNSPSGGSVRSAAQPLSADQGGNQEIIVHVAGAVKNPGLVHLPGGSRVDDALKAAGGPTTDADLDAINLAARLVDSSQVRIPNKRETVVSAPVSKSARVRSDIDKSGSFAPVTIDPAYLAASTPQPSKSSAQSNDKPASSGWTKKDVEEVNVNVASLQELQSLPGVGPSTAQKILDYRQSHGAFKSADDLLNVPGIGEKKLDKMRAYVKI